MFIKNITCPRLIKLFDFRRRLYHTYIECVLSMFIKTIRQSDSFAAKHVNVANGLNDLFFIFHIVSDMID